LSKEELAILRETSCSYDRNDLIRSFWANVKYAKELFIKLGDGDREFKKYEQELTPKIKDILKK
jgi:hypothetical protein